MDRGAAGGLSLDGLNQQLPGLEQVHEDAPVGIDDNGRLVQRTEGNAYVFAAYQNRLKSGLLQERTAKFKKLNDRKIMAVSIPDVPTMKTVQGCPAGI